jgi:hypothetical protein
VIHYLRISPLFSRLVGAIWNILFEMIGICVLISILVIAFAACLVVAVGHGDPLFADIGTAGVSRSTLNAYVELWTQWQRKTACSKSFVLKWFIQQR